MKLLAKLNLVLVLVFSLGIFLIAHYARNFLMDDARNQVLQQAQLMAQRRSAAALQAIASDALSVTSNRFAALQQLINTIGRASDPKAVLDLQARIAAEQGMLQNEQTKLAVLYQAALGQQWANTQQSREWAVAGHGDFASRFQPAP